MGFRYITWPISKYYTHCDHEAILFSVMESRKMGHPRNTKSCWMMQGNLKVFDTEMFAKIFKDISTLLGTAREKFEQLVRNVVAACDIIIPRHRNNAQISETVVE